MAFKSVEQFNDDRYRNLFRLVNDKDSADVIFLYRSRSDMLVADVHYIKSPSYSGYVHCCGDGCPACSKGIRIQTKIFIPVYNIKKDAEGKSAIEFWDKTPKFEPQFKRDTFDKYPNPSEYVFRITRHGVANDLDTRYAIEAVGRNSLLSYDEILAKFNLKVPDYYENVVRAVSVSSLNEMLQSSKAEAAVNQDYVPVPRAGYQSSIPDTYVNAADAVGGAVEAPYVPDIDEAEDVDTSDNDTGDSEFPEPKF